MEAAGRAGVEDGDDHRVVTEELEMVLVHRCPHRWPVITILANYWKAIDGAVGKANQGVAKQFPRQRAPNPRDPAASDATNRSDSGRRPVEEKS